jgi:ribosomal-protein-alanine N-acetyltransferase
MEISNCVKIVRMQEEHIPAVFSLDKKSLTLPWSERSYLFEIRENKTSIPLVAIQTNDGKVEHLAGFIVVWTIEDEAHVGTVAVDKEFRRQGIAQKLISTAIQEAKDRGAQKVFLEVRAGNLPARALYQKLGFVDFDLRKKYYCDNQEDAIIMLLNPIK